MDAYEELVGQNINDFICLQAIALVTQIHDCYPDYNTVYSHQDYPLAIVRKVRKITLETKTYPAFVPRSLTALRQLGWDLLDASHWETKTHGLIGYGTNYRGLILYRRNPNILLLVHRGMQYEERNVANALLLASEEHPAIVDDALAFCEQAVSHSAATASIVRDSIIVHAGFSLGGFLSQITSTYCNKRYQRHNYARCYDPPGAFVQIMNMGLHSEENDNRRRINIIVTAPNMVNTATPQYGVLSQIRKYVGTKPGVSSKKIAVDLSDVISLSLADSVPVGLRTLELHDQDILRKDLLEQGGLNLNCRFIRAWPLAENNFISTDPDFSIANINSVNQFIVKMANVWIYYKSRSVSVLAEMPKLGMLEHLVSNLNIAECELPEVATTSEKLLKKEVIILVTIIIIVATIMELRRNNVPDDSVQSDSQWSPRSMNRRGSPATRNSGGLEEGIDEENSEGNSYEL